METNYRNAARQPWTRKLVGQSGPFKLRRYGRFGYDSKSLVVAEILRTVYIWLSIASSGPAISMQLRVRDVCHGQSMASRALILQQKASRPVQFEIMNRRARRISLDLPFEPESGGFSIPKAASTRRALSTRQYARSWIPGFFSCGLDPANYGTIATWTKATLIYRRTKNLRAVQLLLGHTKLESPYAIFGIEVDDALEMAEQTEA